MPCLPGFFPVMNEVHAGGVIGGRTDSSLPDTPASINFAKFGMAPSAIQGRMSVHVAASNPMITTLGRFLTSRLWFGFKVFSDRLRSDQQFLILIVSIKIYKRSKSRSAGDKFFPLEDTAKDEISPVPSISWGTGKPNNCKIVGAMSVIRSPSMS